jgi:hypothetical protein
MRLAFLLSALFMLTRCGAISDYSPDKGASPSSFQGTEGGAGVQAPLWSDDPGKKTITNQNPSQ